MFISQKKLPLYFWAFVIICPRRNRIDAQEGNDDVPKVEHKRLPMKGDSGINYGNLEVSEPGFDFTDEEINKLKIWPQGIIPYFIDDFSFDKVLRDRLRAFLEHTNTIAGVHFSELSQPPADDSRFVFFINRRGVLPCADLDFRKFTTTGVQKVVIGYDCMEPGNLAEIVLALVGVPPQHNAPNRKKFIVVQTENILPDKVHLFEEFSDSEWLFHEVEYDFTSAGHYGYHKYTANGGATLKPLAAVDVRTGEVTTYSFNDIWKIRMLYNYISKQRQNGTYNLRACSKLFKPGAKFREFVPNEDDKVAVKPRPKPSKYTGITEDPLPEAVPEAEPDDDGDDANENNKNAYKNMDNDDDDDFGDEEEIKNHENQKKFDPGQNKLKDKSDRNQNKKKLYQSDVQTEEKK